MEETSGRLEHDPRRVSQSPLRVSQSVSQSATFQISRSFFLQFLLDLRHRLQHPREAV
jgi:hypothetical protein